MTRCGQHPLLLNSFVNAALAEELGYRVMIGLRTMLEVHDAIATVMNDFMESGGRADDPTESFARLTHTVGLDAADERRAHWSR